MIKNKPDWWTLPSSLLETFLWDIDSLDYEPYEFRISECIHDILNGGVSTVNRRIIDAYWKGLSYEAFMARVKSEQERCRNYLHWLNSIQS